MYRQGRIVLSLEQFLAFYWSVNGVVSCCSLMSEYLDKEKRQEASSVLSTSLVLGAAVGFTQLLILTVSTSLTFPFSEPKPVFCLSLVQHSPLSNPDNITAEQFERQ